MRSVISTAFTNAVILGSDGVGTMLLVTRQGSVKPAADGATGILAPAGEAGLIVNRGDVLGGAGANHYTPGGVGGIGIDLAGPQTLLNGGTVGGGYGGYGYYFGTGGTGGVGVRLDAGGHLTNNGSVFGGSGNIGQGYRGTGGAGGSGVLLGTGAVAINNGALMGGQGGTDFNEEGGPFGYSGDGGAGATLAAGATLVSHGVINGGAGGEYAPFGSGRYLYGVGGLGGVGVSAAAGVMISNSGIIEGGEGGGGFAYSQGAGAGVSLSGQGQLTNNGLITGGAGGFISYNRGATGADGVMLTNGGDLTNGGTIEGGAGGGARFGVGGNGGAGVYLNGGTITNIGTISGGAGGSGYYGTGKMGHAVVFGPLSGTVIKADGAAFVGGFSGFAEGDVIDDRAAHAVSLAFTSQTLTLYDGARTIVDKLVFDGSFTSADFGLHPDGQGGTDIIYAGAGFASELPINAATPETASGIMRPTHAAYASSDHSDTRLALADLHPV